MNELYNINKRFAEYTVATRAPGDAEVGFAHPGPERMFRECSVELVHYARGYKGALEMGAFLSYRPCFAAYMV